MKIQLSDHFNYPRLLRFVLPSVVMMLFTSVYSVVDGLFVSNFVGKTSFAAVNLIMPLLMGLAAVGFLLGTGGSALVARTLGEGDRERANRYFSMLVLVTVLAGVVITLLGQLFLRPVAVALGAKGTLLDDCLCYGRIVLLSQASFMLQCLFQSFFIAAEKPKLGLLMTVAAGLTNIALDALFVVYLGLGLRGAALATVCSEALGGLLPVFYFLRKNSSLLRLTRPVFDKRALLQACANGSSELMTNLSMSAVNVLYNFQLLRLAGENGVAAYGVLMYINFFFAAVSIGYSLGCAPLVSYHFGAANSGELKNLFRKSILLMGAFSLLLTLAAQLLAAPLSRIFVGYDAALCEMTRRGFALYALSFPAAGLNIFGSSFFTALSDGLVSAAISFLRTLVFQTSAVWLLPLVLGLDGVWLAIVVSELLALAVTCAFFAAKRGKYRYA